MSASLFKKINIKNIGIDPFSPSVVRIVSGNKEIYGAVLHRHYSSLYVYHITSKSDMKQIQTLVGKRTLKERNDVFDKFKKGNLPPKVHVYKYIKGEYYNVNKQMKPNKQVLLQTWFMRDNNQ